MEVQVLGLVSGFSLVGKRCFGESQPCGAGVMPGGMSPAPSWCGISIALLFQGWSPLLVLHLLCQNEFVRVWETPSPAEGELPWFGLNKGRAGNGEDVLLVGVCRTWHCCSQQDSALAMPGVFGHKVCEK